MNRNKYKNQQGFTLIELLVVVSIIALLASIISTSLVAAKKKARLTKRVADLAQVQKALELYYADHGAYPFQGAYTSECVPWGGVAANNVIPGLVPAYMASFPSDPSMDKVAGTSCYIYFSNGTDYKFLDHNVVEFTDSDYLTHKELVDAARDGGSSGYESSWDPNSCHNDYGPGIFSWAVYSLGLRCL